MLAGRTTGATSVVGASDMATKSHLAADNIPDDRRRRVSVLKSTRNLMASLRIERKKSRSAEADPIEHFLRKVDTSSMTLKNSDGLELDDEEGYVPHALQCQLKGKTCIFLPSAPGRLLWDVMIAFMIVYYLFMVCSCSTTLESSVHSGSSLLLSSIFWTNQFIFRVSLSTKRPAHNKHAYTRTHARTHARTTK